MNNNQNSSILQNGQADIQLKLWIMKEDFGGNCVESKLISGTQADKLSVYTQSANLCCISIRADAHIIMSNR